MAGLTLCDVKELSTPGAPRKDQLFIPAPDIDGWSSGPADAKVTNGNGDCAYYQPSMQLFSPLTLLFCSVQDRYRYQPKGTPPRT